MEVGGERRARRGESLGLDTITMEGQCNNYNRQLSFSFLFSIITLFNILFDAKKDKNRASPCPTKYTQTSCIRVYHAYTSM